MRHFYALFILFGFLAVQAQITKGTWLLGGSADFSTQNLRVEDSNGSRDLSSTGININPNAGYFVSDKFALGLVTSFGYSSVDSSSTTSFGIGPFARYYFLPVDKKLNILGDVRYLYSTVNSDTSDSQSSNSFNVGAGPVYFLTKNIALEATLNYLYASFEDNVDVNRFGLNFGFQIHF